MRVCLASQEWRDPREKEEASGLQVSLCCRIYPTLGLVLIHVGIPCEFLLWCVCVVQVSQVDQVRRVSLGCQGLQENLVMMVGLVSNRII